MTRAFILLLIFCLAVDPATAAEPQVAERWAVLIGVDDYANAGDLQYCAADQTALRDRLLATGFQPGNIVLLHDGATENRHRPSRGNIERQLQLVINSAEADDLLIVGFSGHGVSLGGKSFLCPSDAVLGDAASMISLDAVYEQLRDCAARFKLVLVDACRNDPTLGGQRSLSATEGTRQLARSFQEIKLPQGVVLLNSCAPGEISWEEQKFGHGVYMHYVLEGIGGAADTDGNRAVSLNELQRYAGARTRSYVIGRFNSTQRPFYRSEGESEAMDFALLPVKSNDPTRVEKMPATTPSSSTSASRPVTPPTSPTPKPAAAPEVVPPIVVPPREIVTNGIGMKLTLIPAGEFQMGSPSSELDSEADERPFHRVRITKPFLIGIHEVTQGQWQAVMNTAPWRGKASIIEGPDYAATFINWNEAAEFCEKLSEKEGKTYRLPTEAEWEYACRAGTTTRHFFGETPDALGNYAWFGENANDQREPYAHKVGTKYANAWGLYDMYGNVAEWCDDWYDSSYYKTSRRDDPSGLTTGNFRVVRGGSWISSSAYCRSASRSDNAPSNRYGSGLRVVAAP